MSLIYIHNLAQFGGRNSNQIRSCGLYTMGISNESRTPSNPKERHHQFAFFFQQQQIPLASHHSLTAAVPISRSSPTRPSPSTFSQDVKSSRTIGSYMRIFSCQVGRLRLLDGFKCLGWARTALVIWMEMSSKLVRSAVCAVCVFVAAPDDVDLVTREYLETAVLLFEGV